MRNNNGLDSWNRPVIISPINAAMPQEMNMESIKAGPTCFRHRNAPGLRHVRVVAVEEALVTVVRRGLATRDTMGMEEFLRDRTPCTEHNKP